MATTAPGALSAPTHDSHGQTGLFAGWRAFFRQFFVRAFDPYRPELHYMRGPGPACRAKQAAALAARTDAIRRA